MDHDLSSTVLHQLRLVGGADVSTLARRCGVTPTELSGELRSAASNDLVQRKFSTPGAPRWTLTPSGRHHIEQLLAAAVDARGARSSLEVFHFRFVSLNVELLAVCTDWQLRAVGGATVPNDHLDVVYDARVIGRLVALHRQASPLLQELGGVLDRFRCYRSRLDAARRRVQAGQHEWFTRPDADSYHTVWFELHEDLLATLGRSRGDVPPESPIPAVGAGPDHLQEQL